MDKVAKYVAKCIIFGFIGFWVALVLREYNEDSAPVVVHEENLYNAEKSLERKMKLLQALENSIELDLKAIELSRTQINTAKQLDRDGFDRDLYLRKQAP